MEKSNVLKLVVEIISILQKHNVNKWTQELSEMQTRLEEAEFSGDNHQIVEILKEIRSLYGGMGSFHDIFITDQADFHIMPEEINSVNSRLQELQTKLYIEVTHRIS